MISKKSSTVRKVISDGFTIVELLIVIVVIAILATISIVAYNGVQERARASAIESDLRQLRSAIDNGRTLSSQTLFAFTGNEHYTAGYCIGTFNASLTTPSDLPDSHDCWVRYNSTITQIEAASGANLGNLRKGDPYGNPYIIDANEGEPYGGSPCRRDLIGAWADTYPARKVQYELPNSGNSGCL